MRSSTGPNPDPLRVPIQVLAAGALSCVLAALLAVGLASISPHGSALLWAALFLAGAVMALLLLILGLAADPLRSRLARRLEEVERRLFELERGTAAVPAAVAAEDRTEAPEAPAPVPRDHAPEAPRRVEAPTVPPRPPAAPAPVVLPEPREVEASPLLPEPGEAEGWEAAIGSRWLGRVGAAVLVLAVALFLKLGWDQGWFRPSPGARVALGVLLGLALLAAAEAARRRGPYAVLSQALGGAGLGAVTLSLWAAVRLYGLLSPGAGLVLVAVVAAAVSVSAWRTRGRVLAFLAMGAGFLAPFLVPAPAGGEVFRMVLAVAFAAGAMGAAAACDWWELPWLAAVGSLADFMAMTLSSAAPETARILHAGGLLVLGSVALLIGAGSIARRGPGEAPVSGAMAGAVTAAAALLLGLHRLDPLGRPAQVLLATGFLGMAAGAGRLARREGRSVEGAAAAALGGTAFLPAFLLPMLLWDTTMVGLGWAVLALGAGWWGLARRRPGWNVAAAAFAGVAWIPAATASRWSEPPGTVWITLGTLGLLSALVVICEREDDPGRDHVASRLLRAASGPAAALAAAGWAGITSAHILAGSIRDLGFGAGLKEVRSMLVIAAATALLLLPRRRRPEAVDVAASLLLFWGLLPHRMPGGAPPAISLLPEVRLLTAALAVLVMVRAARRTAATWSKWVAWITGFAVAGLALLRLWPPEAALRFPGVAVGQEVLLLVAGGLLVGAGLAAGTWRDRPRPGWIENAGWITVLAAASHRLGVLVERGLTTGATRTVPLTVLWGLAGLALVGFGLASRRPHRRYLGLVLLAVTVVKVFVRDLAAAGSGVRVLAVAVTGAALVLGSYLYVRFRAGLEPGTAAPEREETSPDAW